MFHFKKAFTDKDVIVRSRKRVKNGGEGCSVEMFRELLKKCFKICDLLQFYFKFELAKMNKTRIKREL